MDGYVLCVCVCCVCVCWVWTLTTTTTHTHTHTHTRTHNTPHHMNRTPSGGPRWRTCTASCPASTATPAPPSSASTTATAVRGSCLDWVTCRVLCGCVLFWMGTHRFIIIINPHLVYVYDRPRHCGLFGDGAGAEHRAGAEGTASFTLTSLFFFLSIDARLSL